MPYSHGVAQFLDFFAQAGGGAEETAFLTSLIEPSGRLLDIGAGVGRIAFDLAAAGFNVTALEPDSEMFAALLVRLAQRPELQQRVTPVPAAAGYAFGARFDMAFSVAVLHLLDPASRAALARYAISQVRTGGRVVLEIPVTSSARLQSPLALVAERRLGDLLVRKYSAMQPVADGWWHTVWRFALVRDEEPIHEVSTTFRWYPMRPQEALELVKHAGLQVTETFGGFAREPFTAGDSRTLIVVGEVA